MNSPRAILVLIALSVAALGLASRNDGAPMLVWNASASAPIGLYRIATRPAKIGDFVLVRPDEKLANFIVARDYLPEDIPLLKRVAALSGDEICRTGNVVLIDEIPVAEALNFDSAGRPMPVWSGCFRLKEGEIFLLNAPRNSLDGRYFGATKMKQVVGIAIPVWMMEPPE